MSKHISTYCDNCDAPYNDEELCDCETEYAISMDIYLKKKRRRRVIAMVLAFLLGFAGAIPLAQPLKEKIIKDNVAWTKADSKAYAYDRLLVWQQMQYQCLVKLWDKESSWRPNAYNPVRVMGKNAGGIPQLLGLNPSTPATMQIERGLSYIYHRYGTPCNAWAHFKRKGWH